MVKGKVRRSGREPAGERSAAIAQRGASTRTLLWTVAAGLTVWSFGFTRMLNSDLWFHLAAGRLMAQERAVPDADPWSFTAAGQPWHNHEWLAGLIYHAWERLFGVESLVYWKWGVLVATFLLLYRVLAVLARSELAAYLILLFTVAAASPFFDIRPHLYSLLGYAILLHQALVRPRPSWALPLLFLVWANLHGGVVFGLVTLFVVAAATVFRLGRGAEPGGGARLRLAPDGRRTAAITAACLASTLVNPYGWRVLAYPFELALAPASPSRTVLVEWVSPWLGGGIPSPLLVPAIAITAVATLVLLASGGLRLDPRRCAIALGLSGLTLAMAWQSRRFVPLFAISQSLLAAWVVGRLSDRRPARRRHGRLYAAWRVAAPLAALVFALWRLVPYPLSPQAFGPLTRRGTLPVETLNFAEANDLSGRVFAYFLWGGYVHYRSGGRLQVYLDPRSETVFDAETQRRYYRVQRLEPGWRYILESSGAEYVLWPVIAEPRRELVVRLLASGRWRLLYQDAVSVLLVRSDVPPPSPARQTADSGFRSFGSARAAIAGQRWDEAERHLELALRQQPELLDACRELVSVQRAAGSTAEAARSAQRCREIFPAGE